MSKRKLLLADDSETVQKVVNLTFELEGIEVITFGDGDSAMAQISSAVPDVVLADVNMPGMSGYEICQRIKENDATRHTPVILLVGSFEPFDEEKAMQVGADDYLTKPFQSIRQLVSKVNELLSKSGADVATNDEDDFGINENLEEEKNAYTSTDYGDPGMDDEMIQTNQISSHPIDETAKFHTHSETISEESDVSKTQPLSMSDWQNIYSDDDAANENSAQTVYELADEPVENYSEQSAPIETEQAADSVAEPEYANEPDEENNFAVVDESYAANFSETNNFEETEDATDEFRHDENLGIQPDDIDHFYREPDYQDEDEEETVELTEPQSANYDQPSIDASSYELESVESFDQQPTSVSAPEMIETSVAENQYYDTATEESPANYEMPENEPTKPATTSSSASFLDFDELDLLEINFPETNSAIIKPTENISDTTVAEDVSEPEMETETETNTVVTAAEPEAEKLKDEVAQQLSGVNLSAADIDAIADKVVEKLTARLKE